ncbi:hypothetical protein [Agromyces sp. LHK192]|uniref:hypothetical protein n=1 Tax=Agromyces sp. LHK192 TaxID=2498704 RepID=UPI000FD92622|nr:hypothetical protein [Agromyces sp. LHK192]
MSPQPDHQPSRRELLRPVEYVGGAAIAAVFVGIIALAGTRDWTITLIGAGAVFIIVLVMLALLQMAIKPDASERAELGDGQPGDRGDGPGEPPTRGH